MLIIGPQQFLSTGPAAKTAQKKKSHTVKSPLMQDNDDTNWHWSDNCLESAWHVKLDWGAMKYLWSVNCYFLFIKFVFFLIAQVERKLLSAHIVKLRVIACLIYLLWDFGKKLIRNTH